MGLFTNHFLNVVEWDENGAGILMQKWDNKEIKKGSKLIIRPGQDAVFVYNGKVEGVFEEDGEYDIESDIIPILTTLKSFKFGFNSPLKAEVVFVNTKEQLVKWGTKNAINLQAPGLPGGMPVRAFGVFTVKMADVSTFAEKIAGTHHRYTVDDIKERLLASLDQLLLSWISKEGRDMFNLQADAAAIAKGLQDELDMEFRKFGLSVTDFKIESFNYPEEIRKMQEKAAAQAMVGDVNKYQQLAAADAMSNGNGGGSVASDMVQMQMGMMMGQQMVNQMNGGQAQAAAPQGGAVPAEYPKFCPGCGAPTTGDKFCSKCGKQLA